MRDAGRQKPHGRHLLLFNGKPLGVLLPLGKAPHVEPAHLGDLGNVPHEGRDHEEEDHAHEKRGGRQVHIGLPVDREDHIEAGHHRGDGESMGRLLRDRRDEDGQEEDKVELLVREAEEDHENSEHSHVENEDVLLRPLRVEGLGPLEEEDDV